MRTYLDLPLQRRRTFQLLELQLILLHHCKEHEAPDKHDTFYLQFLRALQYLLFSVMPLPVMFLLYALDASQLVYKMRISAL